MTFYRDRYDVIVIGAALAGLSAAIELASNGLSVLVLEQQNRPGGVSTSIVRNGLEMELSLHEMSGIGDEQAPLSARRFFQRHGIDVDWLRVPECYTIAFPDHEITMHPGIEAFASEAELAVPGSFGPVLSFLKLCEGVFECISEFTSPSVSEKARAVHDFDLLFKTAGYCTKDVMDSLDVPEEAQKLLSPYWLYVGSPLSDLPFTIYALLAGDYIGHGSRIPLKFSHEMALKMAEKAEELGAEIEYRQRVRKILTENGKVSGVVTERGDRIAADLVISGAYPAPVFTEMIDPPSAVSPEVLRALKSRQYSFTVFTVLLMLDRPAEALGIRNYCIFTGECTDSERIFHENLSSSGPYEALIGVCLEKANPEAVPENTCSFSITALLRAEAFRDVHAENYEERRHEIAEQLIDRMSERLQVPLRSHIQEIVIVSPETIARFSGSPAGSIYGYRHSMDDHIVSRILLGNTDFGVRGLFFAGAHAFAGDGMGPQILNGENAARAALDEWKKEHSLLQETLRAIDHNEYEGS